MDFIQYRNIQVAEIQRRIELVTELVMLSKTNYILVYDAINVVQESSTCSFDQAVEIVRKAIVTRTPPFNNGKNW